jgi:glycosyltransferase involved in cell wall biosynthesis
MEGRVGKRVELNVLKRSVRADLRIETHDKMPMIADLEEKTIGSERIKLALVSCGLGRVQRGYEISTSRWQAVLLSDRRLNLRVFSGGVHPNAERVWSIARNDILNSPLGILHPLNEKLLGTLYYQLEQMSFGIGFIPKLVSWQPDVVWTKELPLGRLLTVIRTLFDLKFKIIFANGDALEPASYAQFDHIQHLYPHSFEKAARFGIDVEKMQLLPNRVVYTTPQESREELRHQFGYQRDDYIVICVAAWNTYQKRLDYLIREVAVLRDPNIELLLCGHPEAETKALKSLAARKLGTNARWLTLTPEDVHRALYISDVFVLPSLSEGLPNALIEAVLAGLPVICHPHPGGKYILGDDQWFVDLSESGALANRLRDLRGRPRPETEIRRLQLHALEKFSAVTLADEFYEMVRKAHGLDTPEPFFL